MATVVTNTSTLVKFTLNLTGFGGVTFDLRGSGLDLDGGTQRFSDGTISSLEITTNSGAFSTTSFGTSDLGALSPQLQLPISSSDSLSDFLAEIGADTFALDEPGTMNLFRGFTTDVTLSGSDGEDQIDGGTGDDLIRGGKFDDTLYGGFGDNTMFGGSGDDRMSADSNILFISDTPDYSNTFYGGSGNDDIEGASGADDLFGGGGRDYIDGDEGNDFIKGGGGRDFIYAGDGKDTVEGGKGGDFIVGGTYLRYDGEVLKDNDVLNGGRGADNILGGYGKDKINGGKGSDNVEGGRGSDVVNGGRGNDVVQSIYFEDDEYDADNGGSSSTFDQLFGGKGDDIFVFTKSQEGRTTIKDFKQGDDLLQLLPDGLGSYYFSEEEFDSIITAKSQYKAFVKGAEQKSKGVLYEGDNGSIMIRDLQLDDLSADDFLTYVNTFTLFG